MTRTFPAWRRLCSPSWSPGRRAGAAAGPSDATRPAAARPNADRPRRRPARAHLAVARDVVVLSGMTRTFDVIPPEMNEQIKKNAVTRPDLAKDLDQVIESLKPEMELQKQQMVNAAARVYASRVSEADLKEIAAFFKSPVGQEIRRDAAADPRHHGSGNPDLDEAARRIRHGSRPRGDEQARSSNVKADPSISGPRVGNRAGAPGASRRGQRRFAVIVRLERSLRRFQARGIRLEKLT